ncbi:CPXCG motif-containing cysteine-rich protein [Pontimicrobium sp. MEBiC06410]
MSMLLDNSVSKQTYVEDCEVCCNPIQITPQFTTMELVGFEAINIEQ